MGGAPGPCEPQAGKSQGWRRGSKTQAGTNSLHSQNVPGETVQGHGAPTGLTIALGAVGASGEYLNLRKA